MTGRQLARKIERATTLEECHALASLLLSAVREARTRTAAKRAEGRERKAATRGAKRDARAEVRAICERRAGGRCEACGTWGGLLLHMDHFWGRAREESVESCWMLCPECDREKTENVPNRGAWLGGFSIHCERHKYVEQLARIDNAMALHAAKHPRCRYGAAVCTHAQCQEAR